MLYNCTRFVDAYLEAGGVYCYVAGREIVLNTILIVAGNQIGLAKLKNRRPDPQHDILDAISQ